MRAGLPWLLLALIVVSPAPGLVGSEGLAQEAEHGDERGDEHGGGEPEAIQVTLNETQLLNAGVRTQVLALEPQNAVVEATAEITFDPDLLAVVSPTVAGRLEEVFVVPGDLVEAGDVLAVVNSPELGAAQGEYLAAHAELRVAEQNLAREEETASAGVSAGRDLTAARGEVMRARAAHEGAEQTLLGFGMSEEDLSSMRRSASSTYDLVSPLAGVVLDRAASVGQGVEPGDELFTVGDVSRVWVRADILEPDLAAVEVGQHAAVRTSAFDRFFGGELTYLAPTMNETTRTVEARIEVVNRDGALRPGMFARVEIWVSDADTPSALIVPEEALIRRGGETFVFVEQAPGVFERVEIATGAVVGSREVVTAGLVEGQVIVVAGAFFLESEVEKSGFEAGHGH